MKRGIIWIALTCLIVISLVLASCSTSTTSTSTATAPITTTTTTTKTTSPPVTTASTAPTSTKPTTTAGTGNWWDSLGKPQYGGIMTLRINQDLTNWDPDGPTSTFDLTGNFLERLTVDDWTLNPSVFSYQIAWRPSDYLVGQLAKSWELTDTSTLVFHLRQGIHWQSLPPVNGREFTADDVVFHYNRMFAMGGGFTKGDPYMITDASWKQLASITATDKYTVTMKWKNTNPEFIMETVTGFGGMNNIECPEVVTTYGDTTDWHHAIGTGPFIVQDFVTGSSCTMVKNPNYWGYDERYPQNHIPYVDTLKVLIIPDNATALAAMRTGKIDFVDGISISQAQSMAKTNPEMLQIPQINTYGMTIDPRDDLKPYTDIRVRQALQQAIDIPTIAKTYYNGTVLPYPITLTSYAETGWGLPYDQWPQDLKDQYAYNPTAAKALLAAAGFPTGFNTDIVVDSAVDTDFLQIVKSYFTAIGVNMDIKVMDPASWASYVKAGHKQDALAMTSTSSQAGKTVEPLREVQAYMTGYMSNWMMVSDPKFDAFYPAALAATSIPDVKKVLTAANLYSLQQHYYIALLQPNTLGISAPWLKGYNGQNRSIPGTLVPFLEGFYGARFWIDSSVKKSFGY